MNLRRILTISLLASSMLTGCKKQQPPQEPITSPVPTVQDTGRQQPATNSTLHSSGTLQVLYEGVSLPPAKPGEDGPYVFRNVELDQGAVLPKSDITSDLGVAVNARTLAVDLSAATGNAVDAGPNDPGTANCASALSGAEKHSGVSSQSVPTNYVCLRTGEGRLSIVRVLTITEQPSQPELVNISAYA